MVLFATETRGAQARDERGVAVDRARCRPDERCGRLNAAAKLLVNPGSLLDGAMLLELV